MMNAKEQIEKNTTEYDEARLEEALDILMQMRAVDKTKGYRRIMASGESWHLSPPIHFMESICRDCCRDRGSGGDLGRERES